MLKTGRKSDSLVRKKSLDHSKSYIDKAKATLLIKEFKLSYRERLNSGRILENTRENTRELPFATRRQVDLGDCCNERAIKWNLPGLKQQKSSHCCNLSYVTGLIKMESNWSLVEIVEKNSCSVPVYQISDWHHCYIKLIACADHSALENMRNMDGS